MLFNDFSFDQYFVQFNFKPVYTGKASLFWSGLENYCGKAAINVGNIITNAVCVLIIPQVSWQKYSQNSTSQSTFGFWQLACFMSCCLFFNSSFIHFSTHNLSYLSCSHYFLHLFPVLSSLNNKWSRNLVSGMMLYVIQ